MKIKQFFILSICLLLLGLSYQPVKAQGKLRVIEAKTVLKRGEAGIITIEGKANTKYTIETSYALGDREITVSQMRATDEGGQATFNWVVDRKTVLGTRTAVISGGKSDVAKSFCEPRSW